MITAELTKNEQAVYQHLQAAPKSYYKLALPESLVSRDTFRDYLNSLLEAWRDNPRNMLTALGFNLPKVLSMKFYSLDDINRHLGKNGFAWLVLEEITCTTKDAAWLAQADFMHVHEAAGTIYIDSSLNRYLRLGNGQLFRCSNTDLTAMPEIDRVNIRAYLLGLID